MQLPPIAAPAVWTPDSSGSGTVSSLVRSNSTRIGDFTGLRVNPGYRSAVGTLERGWLGYSELGAATARRGTVIPSNTIKLPARVIQKVSWFLTNDGYLWLSILRVRAPPGFEATGSGLNGPPAAGVRGRGWLEWLECLHSERSDSAWRNARPP